MVRLGIGRAGAARSRRAHTSQTGGHLASAPARAEQEKLHAALASGVAAPCGAARGAAAAARRGEEGGGARGGGGGGGGAGQPAPGRPPPVGDARGRPGASASAGAASSAMHGGLESRGDVVRDRREAGHERLVHRRRADDALLGGVPKPRGPSSPPPSPPRPRRRRRRRPPPPPPRRRANRSPRQTGGPRSRRGSCPGALQPRNAATAFWSRAASPRLPAAPSCRTAR